MERSLRTAHASPVSIGGACFVERWWQACGLLLIALLAGCRSGSEEGAPALRLSGAAMGTRWSAILVPGDRKLPGEEDLQARIAAILESVEGPLSTWRADSEISRFNRLGRGESLAVGAECLRCLDVSERVYVASGGAFDPTVGPLVQAYGFETGELDVELPAVDELAVLRARVGWRRWLGNAGDLSSPLVQVDPGVELDLSAVAKGRGVDAVHAGLMDLELAGLFFELGGEVRVMGASPRGDRWRVGVERPAEDSTAPRVLELPIELSDSAVATSGFGRNQRRVNGVWVAHTFDPRSGQPARRRVGSATVLAPATDLADALATALCVLSPDEALAVIEGLEGVEAVLLLPGESGAWLPRWTSGLTRSAAGPLRLADE